jgi:lipoprotein-releasing system permease protein
MFEFSIACKYLIPRKKHLSVTLIAMMSVGVISLIVWLLLVFLSVTNGIESSWLKKLTDLNAPVRVTPTPAYYSSYYYKVDSISSASGFALKTLGEKKEALTSDPYDPEEDPEVPSQWQKPALSSQGTLIDPVKGLVSALTDLQKKHQSLFYQDYEMSGALLKLQLLRNGSPSLFSAGQESMNFLTQVSYLATPPVQKKTLSSLLIPFSAKDINHLLFLANYRMERTLEDGAPELLPASEAFQSKINPILSSLKIHTLKTVAPLWKLPAFLLPENVAFSLSGPLDRLRVLDSSQKNNKNFGTVIRKGNELFVSIEGRSFTLDMENTFFEVANSLIFKSAINEDSIKVAHHIQEVRVFVEGSLQGHTIKGELPWKDLLVDTFTVLSESEAKQSPPWVHVQNNTSEWSLPTNEKGESGILLPKSFKENGVMLGDRGFLSYQGSTSSSIQEQRVSVFVAGFYDPGIISVGNKCLLVPKTITKTINSSNTPFTFDKISLGGFQVWPDSPLHAELIKAEIQNSLEKQGLSSYWNVCSYKDYEFAKDLLQQFQSDKMLLSLIGIIILVVACCNIISFLILLVTDKKKEIAILQAMGASRRSIALIFGSCGMIVGLFGCTIGTLGALFTLQHIDLIAGLLSAMQGHDAFNPAFYGSSLPTTLSSGALLFIFIATPTLSLLSGLIPAIKASRLCPSTILRSES